MTAGNVVPFRRPAAQPRRFAIDSPIPSVDMPPAEYEAAWRALCCHAIEANAWRDYIEAKWSRLHRTNPTEAESLGDERSDAFDRMLAFVELVASLPVPDAAPSRMRQDIASKREIIGEVWMTAEGERYARYRASIAADEARLPPIRAGRR